MEEPLVDFLADYSDSDVDGGGTKVVEATLPSVAELSSSSSAPQAPVVAPAATEAKPKRRRRTRVRYTDEEIFKMSAHLAQQMELTPRPSMMEVWHAYALQNPECGRTVSALLQEHNRHPELFGPVLPKSPPNLDPSSQTPQNTEHSDPLPPWEPEDEEILLDFIRQHPQIATADWELLQGKSPRRPPQSFRIKYYKNRKAYDEMAHNPSKQPVKSEADNVDRGPFTWQLPSGFRKRPRSPTTPLNPPPRQRRKSSSRGPLYIDESSDAKDSGDDYHAPANGASRASRSPATRKSVNGSAKPLRLSTSNLQRSAAEPASGAPPLVHPPISTPSASVMAITPSATPSWLPEFTAEDKAAALGWVLARRRPNQLLDNFESWIEFAALHPQHSAPEWLCYYLVHLPTFDVVETTMGAV